ncbi:MAG: hypothetical protein HQK65_07685 [Desulfamplus sp.]|nr:hypothetical protein [Desulfamplus sp.]
MDACVPAHMPDVLEMPYRPYIMHSENPADLPETTAGSQITAEKYIYRIGGLSCLAGDVAGIYSFDEPLNIGDKLVFTDMAIYSMVKTNTFNGIRLPSIALVRKDDILARKKDTGEKKNHVKVEIVRKFDYSDFKGRLS